MPTRPSSDLHSVLEPIGHATGLPNEHYVSNTVFEEEKQSLLFDNWAAVDFAKNVPEAGDAKPIDFVGMPLLIVRDQDKSIKVFQNSCRHRGMILLEHPTNIQGVIACPYHGWCYGTDGSLRATPNVGGSGVHSHENICKEKLGLFEIRSHIWNDIIFINVSGNAAEFTVYAGELIERWNEFDHKIYHGGETSSYSIEVRSNWKLAIENYSESYHLPLVHPGLNNYSRIQDHYNIVGSNIYCGQGTNVYRQFAGEQGQTFPDFEGLSEKWDQGAEYVTLFPNVMLGVHRDHLFAIILQPVMVDVTIEHVEIYYTRDIQDADEYLDMIDGNAERWRQVFSEDVFVVEGMQKSRTGGLFDGGRFSPVLDTATHAFHRWAAQKITHTRQNS